MEVTDNDEGKGVNKMLQQYFQSEVVIEKGGIPCILSTPNPSSLPKMA